MLNRVTIKRIYLDNYKLFEDFTLDFSDGLNVFDGPNGYGKTSLFDAIEFLITGDIKRVTGCKVIDGKFAYEKTFFAKDYKKDVVIKAEFAHDTEVFVLAKRVKGHDVCENSVDNNPKKLKEITKTYLLSKFEENEFLEENIVPIEKLEILQTEYFGDNSQILYNLLHYIQQEDRLDFFKNDEKGRMNAINILFQMDAAIKKHEDINSAKRKIGSLIKYLDKEIQTLEDDLCVDMENAVGADVEYRKLLKKNISWDEERPVFSSRESFQETLDTVDAIQELVINKDNVKKEMSNNLIRGLLNSNIIERQLKAYVTVKKLGSDFERYVEKKHQLVFLRNESRKVKDLDYVNLEYRKLSVYIDQEEIFEDLIQKISEYKHIDNDAKEAHTSINELARIRTSLIEAAKREGIFDDVKCPYCGWDWKEKEILSKQIDKTTKDVNDLLNNTEKQLKTIADEIRNLVDENILIEMEQLIRELAADELLSSFMEYDELDIKQKATYIQDILNKRKIEVNLIEEFSLETLEKNIQNIKKKISESLFVLPEEYNQNKEKYQFEKTLKLYFESVEELDDLRTEFLSEKKDYLNYQFALQQKEKAKVIRKLQLRRQCIKDVIEKKMKEYGNNLKSSIDAYQADIITKIGIPFYVYSGRILQSYQGGQGIVIHEKKDTEKLNAIRFTVPGGEHDILYTMSSGQLSGILLAFSLALHKVFVHDGLNVLFIDDPIQCMDDLNIVSFIELLRTEFTDVQVLISTHENTFARYIIYKYDKFGLPRKECDLKLLTAN